MNKDLADKLKRLLADHQSLNQAAIAKEFGVSTAAVARWFNYGTVGKDRLPKLAKLLGTNTDYLLSKKLINDVSEPIKAKKIPVISWIQAGLFNEMTDPEYDDYIYVDDSVPDECFALRVTGDSMTSQTGGKSIPEGSIVIVQPCCYSEELNHKVVIARLNDKATMKELVIDTDIYLKPWNNFYKMIVISSEVEIIGRVIRCQIDL
jgi:SOS-response transcriptional repressor LexA